MVGKSLFKNFSLSLFFI